VDADQSPFARVPKPGFQEAPSNLTEPQADIEAARFAAQSVRRLPLVVRIVLVVVAILFVVGLPLGLLFQGD